MGKGPYLAMTAAEIGEKREFSHNVAWMACQFSPGGRGLSNLPPALPPDSVLLISDSTPFCGHDSGLILRQLQERLRILPCTAVVLDLQRPGCPETQALVRLLASALPCPAVLPPSYGEELDCPLFLPPVPPSMPLGDYLLPWQGRELWLELALDGERIILTESGARREYLPHPAEAEGFRDEALHCHYRVEASADTAVFTLWRTREDLDSLAAEADALGVSCVGLYQELKKD